MNYNNPIVIFHDDVMRLLLPAFSYQGQIPPELTLFLDMYRIVYLFVFIL